MYKSRYDENYYCCYCGNHGKWIPKILQKVVEFPKSANGRLKCPFCKHILRTQPRGSQYRRIYNETHSKRV